MTDLNLANGVTWERVVDLATDADPEIGDPELVENSWYQHQNYTEY